MEEKVEEIIEREDLYIPNSASYLLMNIAKWSRFLSIAGFILLGLMALFILLIGSFLSSISNYAEISSAYSYYPPVTFRWFHGLGYLLILLVYFFPFYFLYNFSTRLKKAIMHKDEDILVNAFVFLQRHFMYLGVLVIVAIALFLISFLGTLMAFFAYL